MKKIKSPTISNIGRTSGVDQIWRYRRSEDGISTKQRSYCDLGHEHRDILDPIKDGIIVIGGGFGSSLDAQAPAAQCLSEMTGQKVITTELDIGERISQKIEKFYEVIKTILDENPNRNLDFVLHSEGALYGLEVALRIAKEDPDKVSTITVISGAGLTGPSKPGNLAGRFIGDSAGLKALGYYTNDPRQVGTYLKGLLVDAGKNAKKIKGTISDLAGGDAMGLLTELDQLGVKVNVIGAKSDSVFPLESISYDDSTNISYLGLTDSKHKHGAFLFKPKAVEAVADVIQQNNNPEAFAKRKKLERAQMARYQKKQRKLGYKALLAQSKSSEA